ncbi:anti-sigma regulatory factor [Halobacillus salinarum]|uniref:Anti-sigma regulatory factor n=1 Tax=Halobacillus salinarum TaxID=2932257 RepID=A0ABY4EPT1_9BACI|nr:anti-sigma regulatory factor [Halobacillus salinarum]UOQ45927.1 anti-sigma regulatory factor [Halobacillus salinarum]
MENSVVIPIQKEEDIAIARKTSRTLSRTLQLGTLDQTRVMTAVSELARNIYKYAGCGEIILEPHSSIHKTGVKIVAMDDGPGIIDTEKALIQGYSTSGGLGAGIPGVKQLMDEFEIHSSRDRGTTITAIKWQ